MSEHFVFELIQPLMICETIMIANDILPAVESMNLSTMDPTVETVVAVIGGAGNVGKGIFQACCNRSSWSVVGIDPNFPSSQNLDFRIQWIKSTIEDVDEKTFQSWFSIKEKMKHKHVEFIVSNDDGNREHYATDTNLGLRNDARFRALVERIERFRTNKGNAKKNSNSEEVLTVHISYIGGSWTRLQPSEESLVVDDSSPTKLGGGSNPYEIAKSSAEENARQLSTQYAMSITFYDYISVVPNFAPNFSVNRMVRSGLEDGIIKFSQGDYGRPLLHTSEGGEFVTKLVAKNRNRCSCAITCGDVNSVGILFDTVLVPGRFVNFEIFANIAKEAIESTNSGLGPNIALKSYDCTPEELRTRCESLRKIDSDPLLVTNGLRETAMFYLQKLSKCEPSQLSRS